MPQQRPFLLQQIKLAGGVKSKNGSLLIMQKWAAAAAAAAVSLLTQKPAIWYELMYERWAPSLISPVRTPREGRRSEWEARFSRFVESFLSFAVKFVCPPVRRGKKENCLVFISCPNNSLVPQERAVFHFKACMGLLSVDVKPKLNLQPLTWETHRSELLLLASVRRDSH